MYQNSSFSPHRVASANWTFFQRKKGFVPHLFSFKKKFLQKDGSDPEHFIREDISEFADSDKFSDFNACEVFALLVDAHSLCHCLSCE